MKEFLTENWKFFVYLSIALLEILFVILFKRRPAIVDNSFVSRLSTWILEAENKYVQGAEKLSYVLSEAKKYLGEAYIENDVKKLVEYLLTLPEKKGKSLNEK